MTKNAQQTTSIVTPVAILSYPWLDEAQPPIPPATKAMFSAALVFDPAIMQKFAKFGTSLDALKQASDKAAQDFFRDRLPALLRNPNYKPGFRTDGEEKGYPEGSVYINARSERRPGLVYLYPDSTTGKPKLVPEDRIKDDFYPGALVRAYVRPFAFDKAGNRGVGFALNGLQLIDGTAPRLDNRKAAQDVFEADASQSPASLEDVSSQ